MIDRRVRSLLGRGLAIAAAGAASPRPPPRTPDLAPRAAAAAARGAVQGSARRARRPQVLGAQPRAARGRGQRDDPARPVRLRRRELAPAGDRLRRPGRHARGSPGPGRASSGRSPSRARRAPARARRSAASRTARSSPPTARPRRRRTRSGRCSRRPATARATAGSAASARRTRSASGWAPSTCTGTGRPARPVYGPQGARRHATWRRTPARSSRARWSGRGPRTAEDAGPGRARDARAPPPAQARRRRCSQNDPFEPAAIAGRARRRHRAAGARQRREPAVGRRRRRRVGPAAPRPAARPSPVRPCVARRSRRCSSRQAGAELSLPSALFGAPSASPTSPRSREPTRRGRRCSRSPSAAATNAKATVALIAPTGRPRPSALPLAGAGRGSAARIACTSADRLLDGDPGRAGSSTTPTARRCRATTTPPSPA